MLWTLLIYAFPVMFAASGMLLLFVIVLWWRFREKRQIRHSPLTKDLMRPPGHSLRQKLEQVELEINVCTMCMMALPFVCFSMHISQSYFGGQPETVPRILISSAVVVTATFFLGRRLIHFLQQRKYLLLGLDGETATGEELNQLMLDGCRVFHDISFPYGNIDHVVVSRSGVYSINTKILGKRQTGEGRAEAVVDYRQGVVRFPDRTWKLPVTQLETESKWLAMELTKAVGHPVEVEPMIALPGWYISERIGKGSVYVFNPSKPKKFFVRSRLALSDEMIQRIAHQIEQLSRDVKPVFRKKREWTFAKQ